MSLCNCFLHKLTDNLRAVFNHTLQEMSNAHHSLNHGWVLGNPPGLDRWLGRAPLVWGWYQLLLNVTQLVPLKWVTQETLDRLDHGHVFLRGKRECNA